MRTSMSLACLTALLASFCLPACAIWHRGPELRRINDNRRATYRLDVPFEGHGSGTVVSHDGHVLTAAHVAVAAASGLEITIEEGNGVIQTYPAQIVAIDVDHDMAVVKIDRHFDRPAALEDPDAVHPGDAIYNVGYPYDFGEMVGRGYVQKTGFDLTEDDGTAAIQDAILVDMPDGPGTSGSGIFLARSGKLIGVMSMALWAGGDEQPATVTRVLGSVRYARALLDECGVRYLTSVPPLPTDPATAQAALRLTITIAPAAKR